MVLASDKEDNRVLGLSFWNTKEDAAEYHRAEYPKVQESHLCSSTPALRPEPRADGFSEIGNRLRRVDNCPVFSYHRGSRAWRTGRNSETAAALVASREEATMAHTNRGRVILGGLVAGLVINI